MPPAAVATTGFSDAIASSAAFRRSFIVRRLHEHVERVMHLLDVALMTQQTNPVSQPRATRTRLEVGAQGPVAGDRKDGIAMIRCDASKHVDQQGEVLLRFESADGPEDARAFPGRPRLSRAAESRVRSE